MVGNIAVQFVDRLFNLRRVRIFGLLSKILCGILMFCGCSDSSNSLTIDPANLSITWWGDSSDYTEGEYPSVSITKDGTVMEVHKSENKDTLWYTLGTMDSKTSEFNWRSDSSEYTTGQYPSIAISENGTVVEVHETEKSGDQNLYCLYGTISSGSSSVSWGVSNLYTKGLSLEKRFNIPQIQPRIPSCRT